MLRVFHFEDFSHCFGLPKWFAQESHWWDHCKRQNDLILFLPSINLCQVLENYRNKFEICNKILTRRLWSQIPFKIPWVLSHQAWMESWKSRNTPKLPIKVWPQAKNEAFEQIFHHCFEDTKEGRYRIQALELLKAKWEKSKKTVSLREWPNLQPKSWKMLKQWSYICELAYSETLFPNNLAHCQVHEKFFRPESFTLGWS